LQCRCKLYDVIELYFSSLSASDTHASVYSKIEMRRLVVVRICMLISCAL
jgi:hypothetical protein